MEILGEKYDEYYGFAWDSDEPWQGYEEPEDNPRPTFVCELPAEVIERIKEDARKVYRRYCNPRDVDERISDLENEKIVDIFGSEPGMLSAEKYSEWL